MKKITILVLVLSGILTGCGRTDLIGANLSGYSQICVNGVSYLQFSSGASVEYTPEGKVKTCTK